MRNDPRGTLAEQYARVPQFRAGRLSPAEQIQYVADTNRNRFETTMKDITADYDQALMMQSRKCAVRNFERTNRTYKNVLQAACECV
eukprot:SAG11_NODE_3060_length_2718_cov_5.725468_3_plen_87_part_00